MAKTTQDTNESYLEMVEVCRRLFLQKAQDYGTSWRILRLTSVTDQIYIKAQRIRSLEEKKVNLVGDSIQNEYIGIINYSVIALIIAHWQAGNTTVEDIEHNALTRLYDEQITAAFEVMKQKNHDYGEAWRHMRVSSITDLILMKLLRLKQIEDNHGKTIVSEGVKANYIDILNYAVFCLIRIRESEQPANI